MKHAPIEKDILKLPLEANIKKLLSKLIKRLNKLYETNEILIEIDEYSYETELTDEKYEMISNCFLFPTNKIYEYDGIVEKHIGYRVCFIRRIKDEFKRVDYNVWNETIQNNEWLKAKELKGFIFETSRFDFNKLLIFNDKLSPPRKLLTSTVGWVNGEHSFQYVPLTNFVEDNITIKKDTLRNFKFSTSELSDQNEAFRRILELLNVTDKKITIPLISFTVLSSLRTLVRNGNKKYPSFIICLIGENGNNKEALANLFCNIYNRSSHIFALDSKLHSNQVMKSEIIEKANKHRDSVFISKISKLNDSKIFLKLLKENTLSNGLLLISSKHIEHDSILNLNILDLSFDKDILLYHKSNPDIFSKWFSSFIHYIQNTFNEEKMGLGVKENIDKMYKACRKQISDLKADFDPNKLEHNTWLLVGYIYFLYSGFKTNAISAETFSELTDEGIQVFQESSLIQDNHTDQNDSVITVHQIEVDSLAFLDALDKCLKDEFLYDYEERSSKKLPDYGWISKENLYLKNEKIFNIVKKYLMDTEQKKLKSKSNEIYQYLYDKGIVDEKAKDGWGIQIVGSSKAISYNIYQMKQALNKVGYKLTFLSSK